MTRSSRRREHGDLGVSHPGLRGLLERLVPHLTARGEPIQGTRDESMSRDFCRCLSITPQLGLAVLRVAAVGDIASENAARLQVGLAAHESTVTARVAAPAVGVVREALRHQKRAEFAIAEPEPARTLSPSR